MTATRPSACSTCPATLPGARCRACGCQRLWRAQDACPACGVAARWGYAVTIRQCLACGTRQETPGITDGVPTWNPED